MQYTDKDTSIISQVAVKCAVELIVADKTNGQTLRDAAAYIRQEIVNLSAQPIAGPAPAAVAAAPTLAPVIPITAQAAVAPVAIDFAAEIAASDATQAAVAAVIPGGQVTLASAPPHAEGKDINLSKPQKAENKAWATALLQHDVSLFWDNRADKASGQKSSGYPDFKHKDSGVGLWLD